MERDLGDYDRPWSPAARVGGSRQGHSAVPGTAVTAPPVPGQPLAG